MQRLMRCRLPFYYTATLYTVGGLSLGTSMLWNTRTTRWLTALRLTWTRLFAAAGSCYKLRPLYLVIPTLQASLCDRPTVFLWPLLCSWACSDSSGRLTRPSCSFVLNGGLGAHLQKCAFCYHIYHTYWPIRWISDDVTCNNYKT